MPEEEILWGPIQVVRCVMLRVIYCFVFLFCLPELNESGVGENKDKKSGFAQLMACLIVCRIKSGFLEVGFRAVENLGEKTYARYWRGEGPTGGDHLS